MFSKSKLKRILTLGLLGLVGFIVLAYLLLAAGLWTLERIADEETGSTEALSVRSSEEHRLRVFDSGRASLNRRLELIRSAKKSIDLEFFIFNIDQSSRIMTQALVDKANEGVKVRLMVDFSAPVFQLRPAYARLMKNHGIEVRYYNTSPLFRFISSQHRSHRKLLIVDDEIVLTGGRNIANDYFDLSETYNFLDTDLEIAGPIVSSIRKSFDVYWESDQAEDPNTDEVDAEEVAKLKHDYLTLQQNDLGILFLLKKYGISYSEAAPEFKCNDIQFVTDYPKAGEKNRKVFKALVEILSQAESEVFAESPYFVINDGGYEVLEELHNRKISLKVLTNSLRSTDADYVVAALLWRLGKLAKINTELFAYKGKASPAESQASVPKTARWGLHSKRAVIDGKHTLIGTYNVDPRSANLNSELIVICRDQPELANKVLSSIQNRINQSAVVIDANGNSDSSALLQKPSLKQWLRFIVVFPLAHLFAFLL